MKWRLISEAYTPEDMSIIDASFKKDVLLDRYTPTVGFLQNAYHKLNVELFNGELPEDIEFKIEHDLKNNSSGRTLANDNEITGTFVITCVSINGTVMRTIHGWLEIILHEMIHIYDFKFHPEHFKDRKYNAHKDWFEGFAKRFRKDGFNVKTELDKDDVSISVDDENIRKKHNDSIFIELGRNPIFNTISLLKIASSDRDLVLAKLKKLNCKSVKIVKTNNLNSSRLDDIYVDDIKTHSYQVDDEFNKEYGPFEEIETIDLTKLTFDESSFHRERQRNLGWVVLKRYPNGGRLIEVR